MSMKGKSFKQQRDEIAKGKPQSKDTAATPLAAASDSASQNSSNGEDNSAPDNIVNPSGIEGRLARIEEELSSLGAGSYAGEGKLQMDEQDKIQLRNIITLGVENKLKLCLPSLIAQSLTKAEDKKVDGCAVESKKEDMKVIQDYCREVSDDYSTVVALAIAMDDRSQRDLKSREEDNRLMHKMRANQNTALNAAVRFGKQLQTGIFSKIDLALGKRPKPELPENCSFSDLMKFTFWQAPKYYILCFLYDRNVRWFFRTIFVCAFVIMFSLICFMARDLAKCEVEAEKYHLIRDWVNVDSTKAAGKCFYLDGLFEDRDNNEELIQRLRIGIQNERMRRQAK